MTDRNFFVRVEDFNRMYGLPAPDYPLIGFTDNFKHRLKEFKRIISEEVDEVDDIIKLAEQRADPEVILTALADWLGDIVVYASSEAVRHGIPIEDVLQIIMNSNESKLDENGKPSSKMARFRRDRTTGSRSPRFKR